MKIIKFDMKESAWKVCVFELRKRW